MHARCPLTARSFSYTCSRRSPLLASPALDAPALFLLPSSSSLSPPSLSLLLPWPCRVDSYPNPPCDPYLAPGRVGRRRVDGWSGGGRDGGLGEEAAAHVHSGVRQPHQLPRPAHAHAHAPAPAHAPRVKRLRALRSSPLSSPLSSLLPDELRRLDAPRAPTCSACPRVSPRLPTSGGGICILWRRYWIVPMNTLPHSIRSFRLRWRLVLCGAPAP